MYVSGNMVQVGLWDNCCNSCKFCLLRSKFFQTDEGMIKQIRLVQKNLDYIDWKNEFSAGISLLGGEIYFTTNPKVQEAFLELIDDIIEKVLKVSKNPCCRYSTVTNGLYDPTFLFKVIDRIKEKVGMGFVDVNFSYDLKYRFTSEERRKLCLENINKFHDRYNYKVGVQMILTQYLIDMIKKGEFDINKFEQEEAPGNMICLLYPHKINTGIELPDFFFKRKDFLEFMKYLRQENIDCFRAFVDSTRNSSTFKWTGMYKKTDDYTQQPVLTGDKEILNPKCGHSILYQCYSDTDKCMMCDINNLCEDSYE